MVVGSKNDVFCLPPGESQVEEVLGEGASWAMNSSSGSSGVGIPAGLSGMETWAMVK